MFQKREKLWELRRYMYKRDCQVTKSFLWVTAVMESLPSHCSGCDSYAFHLIIHSASSSPPPVPVLEPPLRPASRARSLPGSKLPDEALPPLEAMLRWRDVSGVVYVCGGNSAHETALTCLSGSMLAKPPEWLALPPLDAISLTSSLGLAT